MKVAVSSTGPGLDDAMDPRLGRCEYLLVVDLDTMEIEALANESKTRGGGAGIQTAKTIAERGATVVLTGNCGPNAYETLSAAGIQVITGLSGTVQEALDLYKRGEVTATDGPNIESHAGLGGSGPSMPGAGYATGQGSGPGMGSGRRLVGGGRGMGGGRGLGCGRGMGAGGGRGMGMWSAGLGGPGPAAGGRSPSGGSDEISALRGEVEQMNRRLGEVLERLRRLEKA
jgi:predicted Fe-Mo cluster-binding NifX family protein